MSLSRLNDEEEILAQDPLQVRNSIAEMTGMDFHKFSKSMVLAQGDFAAFLNALDSERMDILEKIIGGDIYQQYRERIEQKHQQAKTRLAEIEQDLAATPVMEEAAVEAAQHDLEDFREQVGQFQGEQAELDKLLSWVKDVATLEQQLNSLDDKQQTVVGARDENQQLLARIAQAQPAAVFKDDVAVLDNKAEQVRQGEQTLEAYRKEVSMLQQQLEGRQLDQQALDSVKSVSEQKQIVDDLKLKISEIKQELPQENALLRSTRQQLEEKSSNLAFVEQWLQEHDADKMLLESFPETGKLRSLRVELAELKDKQKAHAKWTKNTTSALKKNKAAIKNVSKDIKLLQKKLKTDRQAIKDRTHGKSFEELEELKVEQQERVNDFQELYELAKVNAKIGRKGLLGFFRRGRYEMALEEHELVDRQNTLQLELAKEENIRKTLEKAVANEALLRKMEIDRGKLEEGKPCPLCGSLKHPYVTRPPVVGDSQKALADQRGKIQELRSRLRGLDLEIKEVQKQEEEQSDKEKRLQRVRSQWRTLTNRLNVASDRLDIDNLSLMKKFFKSEQQQLKEINGLIKRCFKLHVRIEKGEKELEKNEALLEQLKKPMKSWMRNGITVHENWWKWKKPMKSARMMKRP
nr:hypothetical protein [Methylomarinum sp. Ch1-1]MDP4519202.1 hypothetical protein [Methylomarinum sp. Ch1-1]